MTLTFQLPDELAAFLPVGEAEIAAVMTAGLRTWKSVKLNQVERLAEVTGFLANLPEPLEVLALRPGKALAERTEELLAKKRSADLNAREQAEWNEIAELEHVMRVAKARAAIILKARGQSA